MWGYRGERCTVRGLLPIVQAQGGALLCSLVVYCYAWHTAFLSVAKDLETGHIYYEDYIRILVTALETPDK